MTTMFDTASITKLFTAAGIVLLENRGVLNFTDKIHDIIDLSNTKIPTDVEIYHLLTHTSGIADDADEENGEDYTALFTNSPNYAIRNNVDFLPNFAFEKMLYPQCKISWASEVGNIRYGYAFEFVERDNKIFSIYKEGCNPGVCNKLCYYPKSDITFAILSNQDCNVWKLQKEIENILLESEERNK